MVKVQIAVPNEGWLQKYVTAALIKMCRDPRGHDLSFTFLSDKPSDNARNRIIKEFLDHRDDDYLFFIDSDNPPVFEEHNPLDLASHDLDVVGLPTAIWNSRIQERLGRNPIVWNCFDWDDEGQGWIEHRHRPGLQEVDAVGSGAMFIHRRVLQKVKPAFVRTWDDDGIVATGSDLLFCKRAKEAGFRIWVHYDHICRHFKERDLLEVATVIRDRDVGFANAPNINTPAYWDEQWRRRSERNLPVYPVVAELARAKGNRICDFGCGRGDLLSHLGSHAIGIDHSAEAVSICRSRGLHADVGTDLSSHGWFDAIVCTEVLEHLDNDEEMLHHFFRHTDTVIYSVPHDCLPPAVEPEHRRVYTDRYVSRITPHIKEIRHIEPYMVVVAERVGETIDGGSQR